MRSRHLSCVIAASPEAVFEFASDPANLIRWASGLARSDVTSRGNVLWANSPMGKVSVRFTPANDYGVLDHDVVLPSGITVTNPLRVMAHPDGSEIVFTVRQIDLTDAEFERDCHIVEKDLDRLRSLLERRDSAVGDP